MRFLVDANLSPVVARVLEGAGHDAVHVITLGLLRADDTTILERAASDDRVIVSADADFGALLAHGGWTKPSFVLLRSADHQLPAQQAEFLLANLDAIGDELIAGAIVTFAQGRLVSARSPCAKPPESGRSPHQPDTCVALNDSPA